MNSPESRVKSKSARSEKEAMPEPIGFSKGCSRVSITNVGVAKVPKRFLIKRQEKPGVVPDIWKRG